MRTDIVDLYRFYASPLGGAAATHIRARLAEAWGDGAQCRIAGFGYAAPFLEGFDKAERRLVIAPAAQGALRWPAAGGNLACLAPEFTWPLPDASIDRLVIAHGFEETADPQRLIREAWRVLTDAGRLIIIVAHRRGLWSVIDSTPFAAGRPFLKRQLEILLQAAMFRPVAWSGALYFPPFSGGLLLKAANAWERAGGELWPAFSGALLVEAAKDMAAPVGLTQHAAAFALRPQRARPAAAGLSGRSNDAGSATQSGSNATGRRAIPPASSQGTAS
jgi:SAM-dependent methyltransferase